MGKKPQTKTAADKARAGANKNTGGPGVKGTPNNSTGRKAKGFTVKANETAKAKNATLMQGTTYNKRGQAAFNKSGGKKK